MPPLIPVLPGAAQSLDRASIKLQNVWIARVPK
jgi:hypothetical protein